MKGIIERLTADLRWRLGQKSKKHKPKPKEVQQLGGFRIPGLAPFLLWVACIAYAVLGAGDLKSLMPGWEWLHFLLFAWPGWIVSGILLSKMTTSFNNTFTLQAYRKLLTNNERFTLLEYSKYLGRHIERAKQDTSLGGSAEVSRLRELQGKLQQLLREGAGKDTLTVDSVLGEEVDFAAAVVEAYEEQKTDEIDNLDERLPDEIRQRLEELDLEVEGQGHKQAELE